MYLNLTGKIQLNCTENMTLDDALMFEQWLNEEIAGQAFSKFNVGLRVHISGDSYVLTRRLNRRRNQKHTS
jgi:hypothetical protein